jgi:hypothetical protein
MKLGSIPCGFPNCACPEPKLHVGARSIGLRLRMPTRKVYRTKGLPIQHWGAGLVVRECAAKAFIEGRLK